MKTNKFFMALAMGLAVVACTPKTDPATEENPDGTPHKLTAKEVAPTKAQADSVAYLIGTYFANIVKFNHFGDLNQSKIKQGFNDALKAKGNPDDSTYAKQFKIDPSIIDRLFNEYLQKKAEELAINNAEAEEKYLAKLDKNSEILKTESGLRYTIIEAGSEEVKANLQDTVYVHYKLQLNDGKVLEEVPADAESVQMTLSGNIPGFKEGLQLIGEGGKIKLYIPSELAYGQQGNRGIDPNTPLEFEVTLDKVGKFVEPEPEPAKGAKK